MASGSTGAQAEPQPYRPRARSAPPRRRSRLRAALVILALIGLIAGGIIVGHRLTRERVDLRPHSEKILRQIASGEAATVYRQATAAFRELILEEKLIELSETMNQSLGAFDHTIDVLESELNRGPAGRTGRVVLRLKFDDATTVGEFSFQSVRGTWRLLGFRVSIPDGLVDEVDELEKAVERVEAPPDVIRLVKTLGESLKSGDLDAIYAATSPPFRRSVSREDLADLLASRARILGRFEGLLDVVSSAQNKKKDRAEVSTVLQFEHRKTVGTFEFIKTETGRWLLSGFKIPVPALEEPPAVDGREPPEL